MLVHPSPPPPPRARRVCATADARPQFILGAMFDSKAQWLMEDTPDGTEEQMSEIATTCYISGAMYGATTIISYWQMVVNSRMAQYTALS